MKYRLFDVMKRCRNDPALWMQVSRGHFSPDMQFLTTDIKIKGLRAVDEWPLWAKILRLLSSKTDLGIGSTIERLLRLAGVKTVKEKLKVKCRCADRRNALNARFPLR
jgi:hypothetical protein